MAIRKSYVSSVFWGAPRPVYRVDGDWRSYSTEDEAKDREAELARRSESEAD